MHQRVQGRGKAGTRLIGMTGAGSRAELLPLPPCALHLWVAPIEATCRHDLARVLNTVLSKGERLQHDRFHFEKDRMRYLVTRMLLRRVLSLYRPVHPANWRFSVTAFGRPFVTHGTPGSELLNFNLSHSDRIIALGLTAGCALGVDVEDSRPSAPMTMANHFLAPDEVRQLQAIPTDVRPQRFLEFWTLKESYIKARGLGLSLPLQEFSFDLRTPGSARFHTASAIDEAPLRWTFGQWRPSSGSIGAWCVEHSPSVSLSVVVRQVVFRKGRDDMEPEMTYITCRLPSSKAT